MPQPDKTKLPSFDALLKPVLIALDQLGGSAPVKEIDKRVMELMEIDHRLGAIPHGGSGQSELSYRLAWARTYLKKYGLIDNKSRGNWSFTEKYDGNLETIDETLIKSVVRQDDLEAFLQSGLSGLEANVAFEKFALAALTHYLQDQGKPLVPYSGNAPYDAVLPQGVDQISLPVYVTIKFTRSNVSSYFKAMEQLCDELANLPEDAVNLFIFGVVLSAQDKANMKKLADSRLKAPCIVWDYLDISDRANQDSNYMEYLKNPKKALARDAISFRQTAAQVAETCQARLANLKSAYQNEDVILYLGAGISIDAGVPLWSDLINKLLVQMISNQSQGQKLTRSEVEMLNRLAYENQEDSPLTQVRYIRTAFDQEEYYKLVHRVLYSNRPNIRTALLNAITDIITPRRNHIGVKSIVTYNFDDLLERKLRQKAIEHNVVYRETDIANINCLNIYHVHGYLPHRLEEIIDNDMNLIFSEEDYHKVYRDAYCWSNIIQLNSFRESTCLFIGCSLTDPNLRRLLDVAARSGETPRHYAIMKRKSINGNGECMNHELISLYDSIDHNIRDSYFQSLGINMIWIDDYDQIPEILKEIKK